MNRRPFRVTIAIVTLWAFLLNIVAYDLAWAAGTPTELTSVGPDRAGGPGVVKELDASTFSLPQYLGSIRDSWSPKPYTLYPIPNTIIHIQDAHCNYYAQHKIKEIIEYLNREYGVDTVNLEGGAMGYDLSPFTDIRDKDIREKATDHFVKEGLVNGAEYFAINNPEKIALWGVEDARLYVDNLNVYRSSAVRKAEIEKHIKSLNHIINNLKPKIYSKELLEFDLAYSSYKAHNSEFKDYLSYLITKAKERAINVKQFTNIYILSRTLGEEGKVDFKRANIERDVMIDALGKRLSKSALEELVVKTVEFKAERISQKEFYAYLTGKAKVAGLDMDGFPELRRYIIYISMYEAVDKPSVMEEIDALEAKLLEGLYRNEEERTLSRLSKNLALSKNIFDISLTRDDYRYYKKNEASFDMRNYAVFIEREAPARGITAKLDNDIAHLDNYRREMAKFYEYSFKRDEAFIRNIKLGGIGYRVSGIVTRKPGAAILVTGGFHSENLAELFKKNDIAYVSIMPNFRSGDEYECPYFKILSGEKNIRIKESLPAVLTGMLPVPDQLNPAVMRELEKTQKPLGAGRMRMQGEHAFTQFLTRIEPLLLMSEALLPIIIDRAIQRYERTKEPQVINIGIVGAGYGQEPVSVAIALDRKIRSMLEDRRLPGDSVKLAVHIMSRPSPMLDKLRDNGIRYPADSIARQIALGNISETERDRYFEDTGTGSRRTQALNDIMKFYEVDLLDDPQAEVPPLDALLVHNILQYLMPGDMQSAQAAFGYLGSMVKPGGIISVTSPEGTADRYVKAAYDEMFSGRGGYEQAKFEGLPVETVFFVKKTPPAPQAGFGRLEVISGVAVLTAAAATFHAAGIAAALVVGIAGALAAALLFRYLNRATSEEKTATPTPHEAMIRELWGSVPRPIGDAELRKAIIERSFSGEAAMRWGADTLSDLIDFNKSRAGTLYITAIIEASLPKLGIMIPDNFMYGPAMTPEEIRSAKERAELQAIENRISRFTDELSALFADLDRIRGLIEKDLITAEQLKTATRLSGGNMKIACETFAALEGSIRSRQDIENLIRSAERNNNIFIINAANFGINDTFSWLARHREFINRYGTNGIAVLGQVLRSGRVLFGSNQSEKICDFLEKNARYVELYGMEYLCTAVAVLNDEQLQNMSSPRRINIFEPTLNIGKVITEDSMLNGARVFFEDLVAANNESDRLKPEAQFNESIIRTINENTMSRYGLDKMLILSRSHNLTAVAIYFTRIRPVVDKVGIQAFIDAVENKGEISADLVAAIPELLRVDLTFAGAGHQKAQEYANYILGTIAKRSTDALQALVEATTDTDDDIKRGAYSVLDTVMPNLGATLRFHGDIGPVGRKIVVEFLAMSDLERLSPYRLYLYIGRLAENGNTIDRIKNADRRRQAINNVINKADRDYGNFTKSVYYGGKTGDYSMYVGLLSMLSDEDFEKDVHDIAAALNVTAKDRSITDTLSEIDGKVITQPVNVQYVSAFDFETKKTELALPDDLDIEFKNMISTIFGSAGEADIDTILARITAVKASVDALEGRDKAEVTAFFNGNNVPDNLRAQWNTEDPKRHETAKVNIKNFLYTRMDISDEEKTVLFLKVFEHMGAELLRKYITPGAELSPDERNLIFSMLREADRHLADTMQEMGLGALADNLKKKPEWKLMKTLQGKIKTTVDGNVRSGKKIELVFRAKNLLTLYQGAYSGTCFGDRPYDIARPDLFVVTILSNGELAGSVLFNIQGNKLIMLGFDPSEALMCGLDDTKRNELVDHIMAEIFSFTKARIVDQDGKITAENDYELLITTEAGGLSNRDKVQDYIISEYVTGGKVRVDRRTYHPLYQYSVTSAQKAKTRNVKPKMIKTTPSPEAGFGGLEVMTGIAVLGAAVAAFHAAGIAAALAVGIGGALAAVLLFRYLSRNISVSPAVTASTKGTSQSSMTWDPIGYFDLVKRFGGHDYGADPAADKMLLEQTGKWFGTNEPDWGVSLNEMRGKKGVYIGVAYGGQNLSRLCYGDFEQALIVDSNPFVTEIFMPIRAVLIAMARSRAEYLGFLAGVRLNETELEMLRDADLSHIESYISGRAFTEKDRTAAFRNELWGRIQGIFPSHLAGQASTFWELYAPGGFGLSSMVRNMDRGDSWLSSERNFARIRKMTSEGRIYGVTADWADAASISPIARYMSDHGLKASVIYVSNIMERIDEIEDRTKREKTANAFRGNILSMPRTDDAVLLSVSVSEGTGLGRPYKTMTRSIEEEAKRTVFDRSRGDNYAVIAPVPFSAQAGFGMVEVMTGVTILGAAAAAFHAAGIAAALAVGIGGTIAIILFLKYAGRAKAGEKVILLVPEPAPSKVYMRNAAMNILFLAVLAVIPTVLSLLEPNLPMLSLVLDMSRETGLSKVVFYLLGVAGITKLVANTAMVIMRDGSVRAIRSLRSFGRFNSRDVIKLLAVLIVFIGAAEWKAVSFMARSDVTTIDAHGARIRVYFDPARSVRDEVGSYVGRYLNNLPAGHTEGLERISVLPYDALGAFETANDSAGTYRFLTDTVRIREGRVEDGSVVYHEIGHHVNAAVLGAGQKMKWNALHRASGDSDAGYVSAYAKTSASEDFAETYAAYCTGSLHWLADTDGILAEKVLFVTRLFMEQGAGGARYLVYFSDDNEITASTKHRLRIEEKYMGVDYLRERVGALRWFLEKDRGLRDIMSNDDADTFRKWLEERHSGTGINVNSTYLVPLSMDDLCSMRSNLDYASEYVARTAGRARDERIQRQASALVGSIAGYKKKLGILETAFEEMEKRYPNIRWRISAEAVATHDMAALSNAAKNALSVIDAGMEGTIILVLSDNGHGTLMVSGITQNAAGKLSGDISERAIKKMGDAESAIKDAVEDAIDNIKNAKLIAEFSDRHPQVHLSVISAWVRDTYHIPTIISDIEEVVKKLGTLERPTTDIQLDRGRGDKLRIIINGKYLPEELKPGTAEFRQALAETMSDVPLPGDLFRRGGAAAPAPRAINRFIAPSVMVGVAAILFGTPRADAATIAQDAVTRTVTGVSAIAPWEWTALAALGVTVIAILTAGWLAARKAGGREGARWFSNRGVVYLGIAAIGIAIMSFVSHLAPPAEGVMPAPQVVQATASPLSAPSTVSLPKEDMPAHQAAGSEAKPISRAEIALLIQKMEISIGEHEEDSGKPKGAGRAGEAKDAVADGSYSGTTYYDDTINGYSYFYKNGMLICVIDRYTGVRTYYDKNTGNIMLEHGGGYTRQYDEEGRISVETRYADTGTDREIAEQTVYGEDGKPSTYAFERVPDGEDGENVVVRDAEGNVVETYRSFTLNAGTDYADIGVETGPSHLALSRTGEQLIYDNETNAISLFTADGDIISATPGDYNYRSLYDRMVEWLNHGGTSRGSGIADDLINGRLFEKARSGIAGFGHLEVISGVTALTVAAAAYHFAGISGVLTVGITAALGGLFLFIFREGIKIVDMADEEGAPTAEEIVKRLARLKISYGITALGALAAAFYVAGIAGALTVGIVTALGAVILFIDLEIVKVVSAPLGKGRPAAELAAIVERELSRFVAEGKTIRDVYNAVKKIGWWEREAGLATTDAIETRYLIKLTADSMNPVRAGWAGWTGWTPQQLLDAFRENVKRRIDIRNRMVERISEITDVGTAERFFRDAGLASFWAFELNMPQDEGERGGAMAAEMFGRAGRCVDRGISEADLPEGLLVELTSLDKIRHISRLLKENYTDDELDKEFTGVALGVLAQTMRKKIERAQESMRMGGINVSDEAEQYRPAPSQKVWVGHVRLMKHRIKKIVTATEKVINALSSVETGDEDLIEWTDIFRSDVNRVVRSTIEWADFWTSDETLWSNPRIISHDMAGLMRMDIVLDAMDTVRGLSTDMRDRLEERFSVTELDEAERARILGYLQSVIDETTALINSINRLDAGSANLAIPIGLSIVAVSAATLIVSGSMIFAAFVGIGGALGAVLVLRRPDRTVRMSNNEVILGDDITFGDVRMVLKRGKADGIYLGSHRLEPKRQYNVGRGRSNDIHLYGSQDSRDHATIFVTGDSRIFVYDRGSLNGTFINGRTRLLPAPELKGSKALPGVGSLPDELLVEAGWYTLLAGLVSANIPLSIIAVSLYVTGSAWRFFRVRQRVSDNELMSGEKVKFGNVTMTLSSGKGGKFYLGGHELGRGRQYDVGRAGQNGIVLNDASVSRRHAAIHITPEGRVFVHDLGSDNGTFVRGRKMTPLPAPVPAPAPVAVEPPAAERHSFFAGPLMHEAFEVTKDSTERGVRDRPFAGDIWVKAGNFYYKFWVEEGRVRSDIFLEKRMMLKEDRPISFSMGEAITVGRSIGSKITMADGDLSRDHFTMTISEGASGYVFTFVDPRSLNGSRVEWYTPLHPMGGGMSPEQVRSGLENGTLKLEDMVRAVIVDGLNDEGYVAMVRRELGRHDAVRGTTLLPEFDGLIANYYHPSAGTPAATTRTIRELEKLMKEQGVSYFYHVTLRSLGERGIAGGYFNETDEGRYSINDTRNGRSFSSHLLMSYTYIQRAIKHGPKNMAGGNPVIYRIAIKDIIALMKRGDISVKPGLEMLVGEYEVKGKIPLGMVDMYEIPLSEVDGARLHPLLLSSFSPEKASTAENPPSMSEREEIEKRWVNLEKGTGRAGKKLPPMGGGMSPQQIRSGLERGTLKVEDLIKAVSVDGLNDEGYVAMVREELERYDAAHATALLAEFNREVAAALPGAGMSRRDFLKMGAKAAVVALAAATLSSDRMVPAAPEPAVTERAAPAVLDAPKVPAGLSAEIADGINMMMGSSLTPADIEGAIEFSNSDAYRALVSAGYDRLIGYGRKLGKELWPEKRGKPFPVLFVEGLGIPEDQADSFALTFQALGVIVVDSRAFRPERPSGEKVSSLAYKIGHEGRHILNARDNVNMDSRLQDEYSAFEVTALISEAEEGEGAPQANAQRMVAGAFKTLLGNKEKACESLAPIAGFKDIYYDDINVDPVNGIVGIHLTFGDVSRWIWIRINTADRSGEVIPPEKMRWETASASMAPDEAMLGLKNALKFMVLAATLPPAGNAPVARALILRNGIFKDEPEADEIYDKIGSSRKLAERSGMISDEDRFVYRGMRLTLETLNNIARNGLRYQDTGDRVADFDPRPHFTIGYAFEPHEFSGYPYPRENFLSIVVQVDRTKIDMSKVDTKHSIFAVNADIPPASILRIFIFDKRTMLFREFTPGEIIEAARPGGEITQPPAAPQAGEELPLPPMGGGMSPEGLARYAQDPDVPISDLVAIVTTDSLPGQVDVIRKALQDNPERLAEFNSRLAASLRQTGAVPGERIEGLADALRAKGASEMLIYALPLFLDEGAYIYHITAEFVGMEAVTRGDFNYPERFSMTSDKGRSFSIVASPGYVERVLINKYIAPPEFGDRKGPAVYRVKARTLIEMMLEGRVWIQPGVEVGTGEWEVKGSIPVDIVETYVFKLDSGVLDNEEVKDISMLSPRPAERERLKAIGLPLPEEKVEKYEKRWERIGVKYAHLSGQGVPAPAADSSVEITGKRLPDGPVRLKLFHDTTPANAERIWQQGHFDPEVRSHRIVFNQPSGIYCSPERLMRQEFHKVGITERVILEIRANVKRPLDDADGDNPLDEGTEYGRLLRKAQDAARSKGIDPAMASDRAEFSRIFTGILRDAGYDCVIMRSDKGVVVPVILDPGIIEIVGVKSRYRYKEAQNTGDEFLSIPLNRPQPFEELPLPEWSKIPLPAGSAPAVSAAPQGPDENLAAGMYASRDQGDVNTYIYRNIRSNYPGLWTNTVAERRAKLDAMVAAGEFKKMTSPTGETLKTPAGEEIVIIPIRGLLVYNGQFAHIGLGRSYGMPVVWIDADFAENPNVIAHEYFEITKWEKLRMALGLEPAGMRDLLIRHSTSPIEDDLSVDGEGLRGRTTGDLASAWHREAPSIEGLYRDLPARTRLMIMQNRVNRIFSKIFDAAQNHKADYDGLSKDVDAARGELQRRMPILTLTVRQEGPPGKAYRGILGFSLEFVEALDEEELAWLVAHECDHEWRQKKFKMSIFEEMERRGGEFRTRMSEALRNREHMADEAGLELMAWAGYDPYRSLDVLEKAADFEYMPSPEEVRLDNAVPGGISIEPPLGERSARLAEILLNRHSEDMASAYDPNLGAAEGPIATPAPGGTLSVPDREISDRAAVVAQAFPKTERRDAIVKTVVGVPAGADGVKFFNGLSMGLAQNGFGKRDDNKQIIRFEIYINDPVKTLENYTKAMQYAKESLDSELARSPAGTPGRIVAFTPEMEEGMKMAAQAKGDYAEKNGYTIVPDAYTDLAYPDIMLRAALAREVSFWYGTDDQDARDGSFARIKDLLEKVAGEGYIPPASMNDFINNLLKPLRIRPIDYGSLKEWRDMQLIVATSA
ncbi:MAG: FHA domain-containing protein [Candidatus Omnitrophota bacterium]